MWRRECYFGRLPINGKHSCLGYHAKGGRNTQMSGISFDLGMSCDPCELCENVQMEHTPLNNTENLKVFVGEELEVAIYETYEKVGAVSLKGSNPLFFGMVTGKTIIHINHDPSFDFLPGETLMVLSSQEIFIDFPRADLNRPTKFLMVEIDSGKISTILDRLNERFPRSDDSGEWSYDHQSYQHFQNPKNIDQLINQLIDVFDEDHPWKEDLIEAKTTELVIRMLQRHSVLRLLYYSHQEVTCHGLVNASQYIKKNLDRVILMDEVSRAAGMSRANLFRNFKNELGTTPLQYINRLRIQRACKHLQKGKNSVTDVCYMLGFNSISHFISLFKSVMGITPKQFQMKQACFDDEIPTVDSQLKHI